MNALTVRDLMSTDVVTLQRDDPLDRAGDLMKAHGFRHLPVLDGTMLVGIITHRDLARVGAAMSSPIRRNRWTEAGWVMTEDPETIGPDESAVSAAERLLASSYSCLPVLDEGRVVGILTETDFVRFVAEALTVS